MIRLNPDEFVKVIDPIRNLPINTFFARSVTEQQLVGTVFVDRYDQPETIFVLHPYGMALLTGKADTEEFNHGLADQLLKKSPTGLSWLWLQVWPEVWGPTLESLMAERLNGKKPVDNQPTGIKFEKFLRANFSFNREKWLRFRSYFRLNSESIVRTDQVIYETMPGAVIPRFFWNNADDFSRKGIGFTWLSDGKPASTAFAAYLHDNFLELGIETAPEYWGEGLALQVCTALIDYCLENNYIPVWSCRMENRASVTLAQKLGFELTLTLPNYKLSYPTLLQG